MPTKHTNTTAGSLRALRAVPETTPSASRTAAEDKVWQALHAHPGTTTSELAASARVGRSTAAKILAAWSTDGSVERISGIATGGRRTADRWRIAPDETEDTDPPAPDDRTGPDPAVQTVNGDGDASAEDDQPAPDGTGGGSAPEHGDATSEPPVSGTPTTTPAPVAPDAVSTGRVTGRLVSGQLRGMVEDFLRARSGRECGPTEIGRMLGRSAGAITNALEKLVAEGYAAQTGERPKRYTIVTR
ncbi:MarR family transcriptional regulator [Allokutzneria oryzae]|uniref:MarR family transcriptional regulator n=1 Tax=Allokutzneria oryzae TaxID=1378989 RepID=A0ABV5ZPQ3_9PSEU